MRVRRKEYLRDYTAPVLLSTPRIVQWANRVTGQAWRLGDHCWVIPPHIERLRQKVTP